MKVGRGRRTSRRMFSVERGYTIAPDALPRVSGNRRGEIGRRRLLAMISSAAMLWVLMVPPPPAAAAVTFTATSIESGKLNNCLVDTGGAVRCWGANQYGQVGDGSTSGRNLCFISTEVPGCQPTPLRVVGLPTATQVSAGYFHTCALTPGASPEVWCWGLNGNGQLGDGSTIDSSVPVGVQGLPGGAEAVTTGAGFSCALASGDVYCWGNHYGPTATQVSGFPGTSDPVRGISAGNDHACAFTQDGAAFCWGSNSHGQLGDPLTSGDAGTGFEPVNQVIGLASGSGVTSISAGWRHTCAVASGAAICWGRNFAYQLGTGNSVSSDVPVAVFGLGSGVDSVTAGGDWSCAITTSDAMTCWGGRFRDLESPTPQVLSPEWSSGVEAVSVGSDSMDEMDASWFICAIRAGAVSCLGKGTNGELGNGQVSTTRLVPTPIEEDLTPTTVRTFVFLPIGDEAPYQNHNQDAWINEDPWIYWIGDDPDPSSGLLPGNWYSARERLGPINFGDDPPNLITTGLGDGIHAIPSPLICDRAGNCGSTIQQIGIDKTDPVLGPVTFSPSSSTGGATLFVPESFALSVSPTDGLSGVSRVEYYVGADPGEGGGSDSTPPTTSRGVRTSPCLRAVTRSGCACRTGPGTGVRRPRLTSRSSRRIPPHPRASSRREPSRKEDPSPRTRRVTGRALPIPSRPR